MSGLRFAISYLLAAIILLSSSMQAQDASATEITERQIAPMEVEALAVSQSKIVLTWSARKGTEPLGFVIERSEDRTVFQQIATLPGDATSFTDISLPAQATRYYRVSSYDATGQLDHGELVAGTTLAAAAPIAPSTLTVKVSASPAQIPWFFRPPLNTDTFTVAKNYDFFILGKQDVAVREDLRSKGAVPPFFVYFLSNVIHDPGDCTKQPFRNNVADRPGDFCDISANHPDWFLLDTNGARITRLDGTQLYYFMDPGNDEWRNFFISRVQESLAATGYDAIFLDNIDGTLARFKHLVNPPQQPVKYPTDSSYRVAVESFLQDLYTTYFLPNNITVYANFTEMGSNDTAWMTYLQYLNGAMHESFATKWNSRFQDLNSWQRHLDFVTQMSSQGKKAILVCQGGPWDFSRQQYCYGSYLLVAGPGVFVRYSASGIYNTIVLYGNYNLDLGEPIGPRFSNGDGLWRRTFTKGSVVVDPVAHTAQIVRDPGIQLDLSWKDNSTDETGFKIERSLDGVNFLEIATTPADTTRYSNKELASSTKYYYRVRSYSDLGDSAYTPVRNVTTPPPPPVSPSNLKTNFVSSTQVKLAWTDNSTNEKGFQVERSFNGSQFAIIATRAPYQKSYTDTLLEPSKRYYYRISSFNTGGFSAPTPNLSVTTAAASLPAIPTNLIATVISSTQIDLQWTDTANNDEGFKIERSSDGVEFTFVGSTQVNISKNSDISLSPAQTYYYRVRAFNAFGLSEPSNVVIATTPP